MLEAMFDDLPAPKKKKKCVKGHCSRSICRQTGETDGKISCSMSPVKTSAELMSGFPYCWSFLSNIKALCALHRNPDPANIPCYRVVNANGALSGEFAFGGADRQAELLRAEGVEVIDGVVDLGRYGTTTSGFVAQTIQHEMDHLEGKLI